MVKESEAPRKGYYNAQITAKLLTLLNKGVKTHLTA